MTQTSYTVADHASSLPGFELSMDEVFNLEF